MGIPLVLLNHIYRIIDFKLPYQIHLLKGLVKMRIELLGIFILDKGIAVLIKTGK